MQLRFSFRLDPAPGQRIELAKAFGCTRVVFNDALRLRNAAHEAGLPFVTDADPSRQVITEAKKRPDRVWLGEVSAVVLQQAPADCMRAFGNFFASLSGKRKGQKLGAPRFRSRKDNRQMIRFTRNSRFSITPGAKPRLPKIGDVAVRWSRELPSEPSSVSVIKDAAGRYLASFVVEASASPLPESGIESGIDLGLGRFAALSDGRKIDSPRFLRRAERKPKRAQQALSRKEKGSKKRAKAPLVVVRRHARVAGTRREFHHRLSTQIIRENQAVYLEGLAVKGLARTRLAGSVHDAGWSSFVAMLECKARLYGRTFVKVGRWFPSSRLCSVCEAVRQDIPLSVREWTCSRGATHDRDINAALDILATGRAERQNACGGPVRPGASPARPVEAGSQGSAAA
ncbi:RNA-guided endonuclease TnpB family protein [Nonomuraea maheshkhaliensis]|uniref:RNA-guided endonuclease TnpB family protein n=1 Tax=Nonomuraea maheshkhaliensis TaxID=419590 RepID=A0ABN2EW45_9ACTN